MYSFINAFPLTAVSSGQGIPLKLLYKRIEAGRMKWPRTRDDVCNISPEELHRLLDGLTILEEPSVRRADCTEIA